MKKIVQTAFILIFSQALFAADYFSGEAGLLANFINTENYGFEPALKFNGFLSGQLAFSNSFSVRGEFSIQTDDLFDEGLMKEVSSTFRFNEISATYNKSFANVNHSFSIFKGCFESLGSEQFISRHLGVQKYSSFLTQNYLGLNGTNVYDLYGTGLSYTLTSKRLPVCTGFVISRNYENVENCAQLNTDIRFGFTSKALTVDALAGLGAPLYTTDDNDNDVVLLIETLYFHTGVDILLGNEYSILSMLLQGGFEYLPVKKTSRSAESYLHKDEIYLLLEGRLSGGPSKFYISFFHIPDSMLDKMSFIDDNIGVNTRIFADKLYTKNHEYNIGLNFMAGLKGITFANLDEIDVNENFDLKLIPFTEISLNGGLLTCALQVGITRYANNDDEALKLHIGYKKEL